MIEIATTGTMILLENWSRSDPITVENGQITIYKFEWEGNEILYDHNFLKKTQKFKGIYSIFWRIKQKNKKIRGGNI